jgi:tetratricopeptide (TPR) repeat protein
MRLGPRVTGGLSQVMSTPSAPPKPPNGIALAGFRALIDAHGGRAELEGKSTAWVKLNVVIPATAPAKSPFTALMDGAHVAPATAFVSHAYDDEFLGVVDAIAALEAREGISSFYYFDLLVVNQHGQDAIVSFEVLRDEFGESVRAIGRTLLYLRWEDPIPLRRAWCVFEMGTTLAVRAEMKVIMPPADAAAFKEALVHDFDSLIYKTCRVDVEKASAREASDLANIKRAIVESGGFLKTNQLVIGALREWMAGASRAALNTLPTEERATSALITSYAGLLLDYGKLEEAAPLYLEALEGRRRTLGDTHPNTLASINNYAMLLRKKGKLEEAAPLCREALESMRRTLGDAHPSTLNAINNYAGLLKEQGKLKEAAPLYREALESRRRTLGNTHERTLWSINNFANLLRDQGNLEEAALLHAEALGCRRHTLGSTHPWTLDSISNYAVLCVIMGKLEEAAPLCREALEGRRRTMGDTHPSTLWSINNFAVLLSNQGKLDEALPLYREALEGMQRTLGVEHHDTLWSINNLATCLRRQGRFDEALPLAREAHAGRCASLGESHPDTLRSAHELGVLLRLLGAPARALPFAAAAHEGRVRIQGCESRYALASQLSLARLRGDGALAAALAARNVKE